MAQFGSYSLQHALNDISPATKRVKLGDLLNTMINAINAINAQNDIGIAIDSGAAIFNTGGGTLTVGGTITNGNSFTVTFTSASFPLLVSGLMIGPVNIVAADTTTTVAAKLATAINASQTLTNYGYGATSAAAVVTVKAVGAAGTATVMTSALSAGATISITAVNPTGGTGVVPSRSVAAYPLTPLSSLA